MTSKLNGEAMIEWQSEEPLDQVSQAVATIAEAVNRWKQNIVPSQRRER